MRLNSPYGRKKVVIIDGRRWRIKILRDRITLWTPELQTTEKSYELSQLSPYLLKSSEVTYPIIREFIRKHLTDILTV